MSKRKRNTVHTGGVIHDTPKLEGCLDDLRQLPIYPGYNCGYDDRYPSISLGSVSEYTAYWERILYLQTITALDFQIPEEWDKDYFLWTLFRNGYIALIDTTEYGIIPQHCSLGAERNVYYQPTRVVIANPAIKDHKKYILRKNAALLRLTPDYDGIWPLIHHYAEELARLTQSLQMAIVNSRLFKAFATDDFSVAQGIRAMLEETDEGASHVILMAGKMPDKSEGKLPYMEIDCNPGPNYLVDKLQDAIENCIARYQKAIGIPTVSDKKERLISSEANAQIGAALTSIDIWIDCLTRSIEIAKKTFPGLEISVKRPSYDLEEPEDKKGDEDGKF